MNESYVHILSEDEVVVVSLGYFLPMMRKDARNLRMEIYANWTYSQMQDYLQRTVKEHEHCNPLCQSCKMYAVMIVHVLNCADLFCPVCQPSLT